MSSTDNLRWVVNALTDSPRLHVFSRADGTYQVESADDLLLYTTRDARFLPESDPLYTDNRTFWRSFLLDSKRDLVTEFRRHNAPDSSVGMSIKKGSQTIKTGLEFLSAGYGSSRYNIKWQDTLFYFENTRQAPNSTASDGGSLRCLNTKGVTLAWLTRAIQREEDLYSSLRLCATIWFEDTGISDDLVDMIISGLLAITDIQFPISPRKSQC